MERIQIRQQNKYSYTKIPHEDTDTQMHVAGFSGIEIPSLRFSQ